MTYSPWILELFQAWDSTQIILKVTNSDHINPSYITIAAVVRLWHDHYFEKIYCVSVGLSEDLRAKSWSCNAFLSVQIMFAACPVSLPNLDNFLKVLKTGASWHTPIEYFSCWHPVWICQTSVKAVFASNVIFCCRTIFWRRSASWGQDAAWRNHRHHEKTQSSCSMIEQQTYKPCSATVLWITRSRKASTKWPCDYQKMRAVSKGCRRSTASWSCAYRFH